jgi:hypothetical protein
MLAKTYIDTERRKHMSETRRSGLEKRYAESARTKDSGGGGQIFNFPSSTKFYKPRDDRRNRIIIVPYTVKSKNHPLVVQGKLEIGEIDSVMDVWVHRSVGPGEIDVVCLKKNYLKSCPCCIQADEYKAKGMEKEYKALKASRRVTYNVLDANDVDKGLMIFSASHYLFDKELVEEAIAAGKDGRMVDYAGIDHGRIITFRGSMTSAGKTEFMEFKSFSFEARDEVITAKELDRLIDKTISLDEIMKVMTSSEVEAAIYGLGDDDDDDRPRTQSASSRDADEEERSSRRSRDDEDEKPSRRERDRDTEESQERRHRRDDDEGEKSSSKKEDSCPAGYEFGKDWDRKEECDHCKVWDRCEDAYMDQKKKEKETK